MMTPDEWARAAVLREGLELHGLPAVERPGPYGRTLGAIRLYRRLAHEPDVHDTALEQLAELLCLYAAAIVRGAGEGISPYPPDAGNGPGA